MDPMKKLLSLLISASVLLVAIAPAMAQKTLPPLATATRQTSKVAGTMSLSGMVKGKIKGKTLVLATRKGNFTVDATKAKVKSKDGKFMKFELITGGSQIVVLGEVKGTKMTAKTITVNMLNGAKKPPTGGLRVPSKGGG